MRCLRFLRVPVALLLAIGVTPEPDLHGEVLAAGKPAVAISALAAPSLEAVSSNMRGLTLEFGAPGVATNASSAPPESLTYGFLIALPEGGAPSIRSESLDVRLGEPASFRGLRVAALQIQPAHVDPVTGAAHWPRKMQVEVSFDHSGERRAASIDSASGATLEANFDATNAARSASFWTDPAASRRVPPSFDALYRALVPNYEQAAGGGGVQPGAWVVITPDDPAVTARLAPLLEWRRRQGFTVRAVTMAETGITREAIRTWLRNAYETWETPPEYVVLAGDSHGQYVVPTWFDTISGSGGEGDHPYALLDGDDVLPEVHLGRLSFSTLKELEVIVSKIVGYESRPDLSDPDWFLRACLVSDASVPGGFSGTQLQRWAWARLLELGYTEVDTVFLPPIIPGMKAGLDHGASLFSYRGVKDMSGWTNTTTYNLTNGGKLPFIVALTCDTGSFHQKTSLTEGFLRAANSAGVPIGGIGAIGTATNHTHTRYNDCFQFGILQGLLYEGQTSLGGALTRGQLEMYRNYQTTEPAQVAIWLHWNNLMGDPAVDCWTGVPESLTVIHPASISVGTNAVRVTVLRGGRAEPAARVCLWDGEEQSWTARTDAEGRAELEINTPAAATYQLTVTGHNRLPYMAAIPVSVEPVLVGYESSVIDDDGSGESRGNGDGSVNPGETLELRVRLHNFGTGAAAAVSATLTSTDPFADIIHAEREFGDLPAGASALSTDVFAFSVRPDCPAGRVLRFDLDVRSGPHSWRSLVQLPVVAPVLGVESVHVSNAAAGEIDPGETAALTVTLHNSGGMDAGHVQGVLSTESPWVTIPDPSGTFGNIAAGQTGENTGDSFTIMVDPAAYRGHSASFSLVTLCNGATADTVRFDLSLGTAASSDPAGPDRYGYSILDDTDIGYPEHPSYEWIELDPRFGGNGVEGSGIEGNGVEVPLSDLGYHQDKSTVVDLPFTFQFYGALCNQATICSNGWIALGSTNLVGYRNWSLPSSGVPPNFLAVFWDDLSRKQGGRILQKYDPIGHRWIVEWSRMRNEWAQELETFEAILYDPAYHASGSGDGFIVYQYQATANPDELDGYATVGIQNSDHSDGLEYSYGNRYPAGATPLAEGRAVRFVPTLAAPRATIEGIVKNASWSGSPVIGAEVRVAGREGYVVSDSTGRYVLRVPEGDYTVTAGSPRMQPRSVDRVAARLTSPSHLDFELVDVAGPMISDVTRIEHTTSLGPYDIGARITDDSDVKTATLAIADSAGRWTEIAMDKRGSRYHASIPHGVPGQEIRYQIRASDNLDQRSAEPSDAVASSYSLRVTRSFYSETGDASVDTRWRMMVPGDDARTGRWVQTDPEATFTGDLPLTLEDDHTPDPGTRCFVTPWPGVQDGCATLESPVFDLSGASDAYVTFYRWYSAFEPWEPGDGFTISVSSDNGITWTRIDSIVAGEADWRRVDRRLADIVKLPGQVSFRFVLCDHGYDDTVLSAAIDDFSLEIVPVPPATWKDPPPSPFVLYPPLPNPQSGSVSIRFSLERPGAVELAIYDVQGRLVRELKRQAQPAGVHELLWDGLNAVGEDTGGGVFFCRLQAGGRIETRKIVRIAAE